MLSPTLASALLLRLKENPHSISNICPSRTLCGEPIKESREDNSLTIRKKNTILIVCGRLQLKLVLGIDSRCQPPPAFQLKFNVLSLERALHPCGSPCWGYRTEQVLALGEHLLWFLQIKEDSLPSSVEFRTAERNEVYIYFN